MLRSNRRRAEDVSIPISISSISVSFSIATRGKMIILRKELGKEIEKIEIAMQRYSCGCITVQIHESSRESFLPSVASVVFVVYGSIYISLTEKLYAWGVFHIPGKPGKEIDQP